MSDWLLLVWVSVVSDDLNTWERVHHRTNVGRVDQRARDVKENGQGGPSPFVTALTPPNNNTLEIGQEDPKKRLITHPAFYPPQ